MKKIFWIITCCFVCQLASAQIPKWAEKARKAVFSIVTYDKENQIKGTGNGFYIDAKGVALSDYTLFENAERAVIINADGKQKDVTSILGANDIYDIIKFNTPIDKKQVVLTIAKQPAKTGEVVYLLPYSTQKSANIQAGRVTSVDSIGNNSFYYTIEMKASEKMLSCPIMNANGEVLGLIQKNSSDESEESYAIGANYGASLQINALSFNDGSLKRIGIKKALPDTEEQALVLLYMVSQDTDEANYLELLNDFIEQYPNNYEGYMRRARIHMQSKDEALLAQANNDLKKVLECGKNSEETHYQVAKSIYSYVLSLNDTEPYDNWTYDYALELVRKANQIKSTPIYTQLEGDILFAQHKYAEAFNCYDLVNKSEIADETTFYSAAKTKQLIEGSDMNEVIALMDSAITKLSKPYLSKAAPYFYERAELKVQAGKFKEAVMDYNTFHEAVNGNVTALFYFQREQAEMQCRMYRQALEDINKAVEMDPQDMDFLIEKGSVHLRVNQLDEAIAVFQKAISMNNQYAPAYRLLGYCQAIQNKKKEACANFAKAKELGDEIVDQLIEKYCK